MTSSFLQDIIKNIDNEYASLADDGIAAGDTSGYIDTGSYILMHLSVVVFLVVSLPIRSLLSQENHLQVRHSFVLV